MELIDAKMCWGSGDRTCPIARLNEQKSSSNGEGLVTKTFVEVRGGASDDSIATTGKKRPDVEKTMVQDFQVNETGSAPVDQLLMEAPDSGAGCRAGFDSPICVFSKVRVT